MIYAKISPTSGDKMESGIRALCLYCGIKNIGSDGFSPYQLKKFAGFLEDNLDYVLGINDSDRINRFDELKLEEVKKIATSFCKQYLSLKDVYYLEDITRQTRKKIKNSHSYKDFYRRLALQSRKISALDLPIKLEDEPFLYGYAEQYTFGHDVLRTSKYRIPVFSNIRISNELSLLSVPALVHEYVHVLEQANRGFTDDFNNIELLSIFMEKVIAQELGQEVLELWERTRFLYLVEDFQNYFETVIEERKRDNIAYMKSTLYALKLFDMYQQDKNKDKYFDDINKVLSGRIKVEEVISNHNLTIDNCQDKLLLKQHLYMR